MLVTQIIKWNVQKSGIPLLLVQYNSQLGAGGEISHKEMYLMHPAAQIYH